MPVSTCCHMNGTWYIALVIRAVRPVVPGPVVCRLVMVAPACAEVLRRPQPPAALRRSSSRADIRSASFDWAQARRGL
jgi:hypothetical protein